jgi:hypothetical protein
MIALIKRLFGARRGAAPPKRAITDDAVVGAKWIAKALSNSGYRANFSLNSLKEIDRFFDEHAPDGKARPGGLLSHDLGPRIFALGAYVGEVIRRQAGGQWEGDDNDPDAEVNLAVRLKSGAVLWPVQRVMKRYRNGAEDGIYIYGLAIVRPD